ncbi:MAG: cupin domain-containing protein [Acidobacteriota bacterium]|nr:cupin domain-containing protein [Acidobacteriota bacterium]
MPDSSVPVFIPDLLLAVQIPEKGMVSRILQNDEQSKVVLYGLAANHEMGLHAAPVPTMLYFVEGKATLILGDQTMAVCTGAFTHMPSNLKHAIVANTPVLMLLIMLK